MRQLGTAKLKVSAEFRREQAPDDEKSSRYVDQRDLGQGERAWSVMGHVEPHSVFK